MNDDSPDLRLTLAYLKAVASEDHDGIQVLTQPGDLPDLVDGLAFLVFLFIEGVCDDPAGHVDVMFRAIEAAEKGNR